MCPEPVRAGMAQRTLRGVVTASTGVRSDVRRVGRLRSLQRDDRPDHGPFRIVDRRAAGDRRALGGRVRRSLYAHVRTIGTRTGGTIGRRGHRDRRGCRLRPPAPRRRATTVSKRSRKPAAPQSGRTLVRCATRRKGALRRRLRRRGRRTVRTEKEPPSAATAIVRRINERPGPAEARLTEAGLRPGIVGLPSQARVGVPSSGDRRASTCWRPTGL